VRKKIFSFIVALCLVFSFSSLVLADERYEYIYEEAGILTNTEIQEIDAKAADVAEKYGCGVYICVTDDHTQYGYNDIYDFGREYYLSYELGKGEEYSGILLVLSMNERDYTLVVSGEKTSALFDDYALDIVCDEMLDDFADNNWYEGFYDYIDGCAYILEGSAGQTPDGYESSYTDAQNYDYEYYESTADSGDMIIFSVIVSIIVSCIIALIVCLVFKAQMKSVYKGSSASSYVSREGFKLSERNDIFTHSTQVRNRIKTNNSSGGGIRMGGGRSGGGFSGRSGKF